ncbi:MAG: hypothetical protein ACK54K_13040, partial [Gemmatimonadaceae bacterium]
SVGVATQPPAPTAAAALAERLASALYADDALIPASPWLGAQRPARPAARVMREHQSGEATLVIAPGPRARWTTVRVLRDGGWSSHVLPAAFTRLVISGADAPSAQRVVVTAVDRNGNESRPLELSGTPSGTR